MNMLRDFWLFGECFESSDTMLIGFELDGVVQLGHQRRPCTLALGDWINDTLIENSRSKYQEAEAQDIWTGRYVSTDF
jgi:hypothetical protein